jgi:hypothetical protein
MTNAPTAQPDPTELRALVARVAAKCLTYRYYHWDWGEGAIHKPGLSPSARIWSAIRRLHRVSQEMKSAKIQQHGEVSCGHGGVFIACVVASSGVEPGHWVSPGSRVFVHDPLRVRKSKASRGGD